MTKEKIKKLGEKIKEDIIVLGAYQIDCDPDSEQFSLSQKWAGPSDALTLHQKDRPRDTRHFLIGGIVMKKEQIAALIRKRLRLQRGMIVDVPLIQQLLGYSYCVGSSCLGYGNQVWGKALSYLSQQGLLSFHGIKYNFNGTPTIIHRWKVL